MSWRSEFLEPEPPLPGREQQKADQDRMDRVDTTRKDADLMPRKDVEELADRWQSLGDWIDSVAVALAWQYEDSRMTPFKLARSRCRRVARNVRARRDTMPKSEWVRLSDQRTDVKIRMMRAVRNMDDTGLHRS